MDKHLQCEKILASVGWPVTAKPEEIEKILASVGWPVGWESQSAKVAYITARKGIETAPRRRVTGRGGYDTFHLNYIAYDTYQVIKCSERSQWDGGYDRGKFADLIFHSTFLHRLRLAYEIGYTPAVWYAFRYCLQEDALISASERDWLDKFARSHTMPLPVETKKIGRPNGPSPHKVLEDLEIFVQVNFWRHKLCGIYKSSRRPHYVSPDAAFRIVRAMRFPRDVFVGELYKDNHISTFTKAYKDTVKRFSAVLFSSKDG